MSVVPFRPARHLFTTEMHEPMSEGVAICFGCKNEWIAVTPLGTTRLVCPACLAEKGVFRYEHMPSAGELERVCNCGNKLFCLTTVGHLCPNCGAYQSY